MTDYNPTATNQLQDSMSLRHILLGVCLVNSGPGTEGKEMVEMQKCTFAGGRDVYANIRDAFESDLQRNAIHRQDANWHVNQPRSCSIASTVICNIKPSFTSS
jgi:hypothetical protein